MTIKSVLDQLRYELELEGREQPPLIMESLWESFQDAAVPPSAGEGQRRAMRNSFFAGAIAMQEFYLELLKFNEAQRAVFVMLVVEECKRFHSNLAQGQL